MVRNYKKALPQDPDFAEHLANLDHGQLAQLLGDARLVELVVEVTRTRHDLEAKERGQLILDVVGGPESIFEDSKRRRTFFLTLSGQRRAELASFLSVGSVDTFKLTAERRPRLYGFFGLVAPSKNVLPIPPAVTCINVGYGLFRHQTNALLSCLHFLESAPPKVMLHMPTGAGKTRTAMHLVCRHENSRIKGLVIWLVAGKELCEQAANEFRNAWKNLGERPLPLICAWEGRREVDSQSFSECKKLRDNDASQFSESIWPESLDDGIIIGSLDTIWEMIQSWEPGQFQRRAVKVSLMVFDEAHRAAATTYCKIVESIHTASHCGLLGLSATPGRKHFGDIADGTEALVKLFGDHKVQLQINGFASPVEALISQGYLAYLKKEQLKIADSGLSKTDLITLGKSLEKALDLPEETLRYIGLSAARNLQIVEKAERLAKEEGHQRVIIFAPSVESSNLISSVLKTRGIRSASVTSKTDPQIRSQVIGAYKADDKNPFVLCNYGVLTTGFDAPKTSAVIIARPTLSIVLLNQMAGRAIRGPRVGGNATAVLVTVVDTSIPQLVDTIEQFHAFDESWRK